MGSICSCFKKKRDIQAPILTTNMYCGRCGKTFNYVDYQRHIVTCEQTNRQSDLHGGY